MNVITSVTRRAAVIGTALLVVAGPSASSAAARPAGMLAAIPKVTVESAVESGEATLYSAAWSKPAGRRFCSGMFADGIPSFEEPVAHLPITPVDIVLWTTHKPRAVAVHGYTAVAGLPVGPTEEVRHELVREEYYGVWVVRINPRVVGSYHLLIDVEWLDRSRCGGIQQGSWSAALQTGV